MTHFRIAQFAWLFILQGHELQNDFPKIKTTDKTIIYKKIKQLKHLLREITLIAHGYMNMTMTGRPLLGDDLFVANKAIYLLSQISQTTFDPILEAIRIALYPSPRRRHYGIMVMVVNF